jgi:pyruvate dehydrogenase E2 component (dihydrolipoamide acetyltransferase)
MATEIQLPELGENVTEGVILDVRVAPGDSVSQGQTLLEVEADKATVEVPSPTAGRVVRLLVKKGDTIRVGQTLCLIEAAPSAKEVGPKVAPVRETPGAITEPEPAFVSNQSEKPYKETQRVAAAQAEGPPMRDAPAPMANGLRDEVEPPPADGAAPAAADGGAVPAGPATRRLARELGVDLRQVRGSASGGRVTEEDVKAHVRQASSGAPRAVGLQAPPLPDFARWGEIERRPLDTVRRKTAEQMSLAWSQVAHVTQHDQADITELDAFRRRQEGRGPKRTVTAFALKAAAIALRQFPQFNASLDLPNNQLVVKRYYHIGVAVDTERGLLVPVLRDVDKKSVEELAQELTVTAERARQKKLQPDEMRGGTFTITNLGGIGGTAFTPIVNYPEVAILGLSHGRLQPVIHDGQVAPRLILPLSLSYDHRVIDGADAARFTRRVAEMLENPLLMLLHA